MPFGRDGDQRLLSDIPWQDPKFGGVPTIHPQAKAVIACTKARREIDDSVMGMEHPVDPKEALDSKSGRARLGLGQDHNEILAFKTMLAADSCLTAKRIDREMEESSDTMGVLPAKVKYSVAYFLKYGEKLVAGLEQDMRIGWRQGAEPVRD
jgi:hypothetical protein